MSDQHHTPARAKLATPRPYTPPPPPERISGPAMANARLLDDDNAAPIAIPPRRGAPRAVALGPQARQAAPTRAQPTPAQPTPAREAAAAFEAPQPLAPGLIQPGLAERLERQLAERSAQAAPAVEPPSVEPAATQPAAATTIAAPARALGPKTEFRPRARPAAPKAKARPAPKASARDAFAGMLVLWGEEFERHILLPLRTLWRAKGDIGAALLPIFAPLAMAYLLSLNPTVSAAFLSGDATSRLGGMCFLYVFCAFVWVLAWMILRRVRQAWRGDLDKFERVGRERLDRRR